MDKIKGALELEAEEALLLPDRVALSYFDPSNSATVHAVNQAVAANVLTCGSYATATANQGILVLQG